LAPCLRPAVWRWPEIFSVRVLLVSDVYYPRVNGVSTSIATFRTDLAAIGVETVLVVPHYANATDAADDPLVIRVPSGWVPRDPEDRRMHWRALQVALQGIRSRAFALVHIHTPFLAHYAGLQFARAAGIPVVETYHTHFEEYLHHYVPLLPRVMSRRLARSITRAQCNQVDAVIAPSEPMRTVLADSGVRTLVQVIPTGLPDARFAAGVGARFRQRYKLPERRPLVLYLGRVAYEKNIEFLIQSFIEVRRARPDALLVIAGEGPARSALSRQVLYLGLGSDVAFVGYLNRKQELADCYAAAAVFVFASRTETQGLVLLEAMAQGCAIVSTACLGTASILQTGCGARVAPENPTTFGQAVVDFLDDPPQAAHCGAIAQTYARGWSSRLMAWRMREFYADQCARAKIDPEPAAQAVSEESNERQACPDSR
jgi:1,2-diacylglycerol 3-alpha-glucosyltransferase